MNDLMPSITPHQGQPATTSLEVAGRFGKRHDAVLRAIRNLDCPGEFTDHNFVASNYLDPTGRTLPMYIMTRDGFSLLAMGFTGSEAMAWKIAFITAFNLFEQNLRQREREVADQHFAALHDLVRQLFSLHPTWPSIRMLLDAGMPARNILPFIQRRNAGCVYRAAKRMAGFGLLEKRRDVTDRQSRWHIPAGQPALFKLIAA